MEITLEQVEHLRTKANVSYTQAKEALEYSGGNLLDALIYLEERGAIPRPEGAYYSTKGESSRPPEERLYTAQEPTGGQTGGSGEKVGFFRRLRYLLLDNELEIWRKDRPVTALPVLVLILLLCVAVWVVPILILSLFFGFRYRFSGPDLERDSINHVMDNVADSAADLGHQVIEELSRQHERYTRKKNDEQ